MAMGVNFPARTCIIRSPELIDLNVCEVLQMKGRAGRWGLIKDEFALSICWNVKNTYSISMATLPHIEYPEIDNSKNKGIIIKNAEFDAYKISETMITSGNATNLKLVSDALSQIDKRIESEKSNKNYDEENSFTQKVSKSVKNIENTNVTSNLSLISSITVVVRTIGADLNLSEDRIVDLIYRIEEVCKGNKSEDLKKNAYFWTEEINVIKYGLQEIHTLLHKRQCTELLDYMQILYGLIHRVSMRYLGFAFDVVL
jgi:hypothetical protein